MAYSLEYAERMGHGHDAASRAIAARAATDRELREVYDQRQHLEPQVNSLLHQDEHEHRCWPRATNRNWLAVNLPIIRRSVRRVKKRSARGMQSLRSYFTSVPSDVQRDGNVRMSEATATVVVSDSVGRTSFS